MCVLVVSISKTMGLNMTQVLLCCVTVILCGVRCTNEDSAPHRMEEPASPTLHWPQ